MGRQVYCKNVICDIYDLYVFVYRAAEVGHRLTTFCRVMEQKATNTESSTNGTELSNRTVTIYSIGPEYMTQW